MLSGFVSGHGFSRAVKAENLRALEAAEKLFVFEGYRL